MAGDEEARMRWTRLGQLSLEEALLESQASADCVKAVTSQLDSAGARITSEPLDALAGQLDVVDGKCVLLSVLGRGESSLRSLWLEMEGFEYELDESEALALCVNLASNSRIEAVNLRKQFFFGRPGGCELLGNALATNEAVKELYLPDTIMGPEAVRRLMKGLERNNTLLRLDLGLNFLGDEGVGYVADHMLRDKTITKLQLHETHFGTGGAKRMAGVLQHNTCLTDFTFGANRIQKEGMKILLRPLIHVEAFSPSLLSSKNKTLKTLAFECMATEDFSVESVAEMLRTNQTLSSLEIMDVPIETQQWVDIIIPALKRNDTLQFLNVNNCKGITPDVLEPLMSLVRDSNSRLERINVSGTAISTQGGLINEELRKNKEYRRNLKHQDWVRPRFGRMIVCGYAFAGKTSLCRTIVQRGGNSQCDNWKVAWKKFLQRHPCFRQVLYGKGAHLESQERTHGIDILIVGDQRDATSIWDFAGQKEFYVLHDYLFPNGGNTCFLYVCSARCNPDDYGIPAIKQEEQMKEEFRFWLRFIASNSRPVQEGVPYGERRLPNVTFVLTNRDTLTKTEVGRASQLARRVVADCKEEFRSVISLSDDVDIIDTHSSENVSVTFKKVKNQLDRILEESIEYVVCKEVRRALRAWAAEHPSHPLLTIEEFKVICNTKVRQALSPEMYTDAELDSPKGRGTVLAYLNDVGEIIFAYGFNFIVVNPKWFGIGLLGHLIDALEQPAGYKWSRGLLNCCKPFEEPGSWCLAHQNGFVLRNEINHLLQESLKAVNLPETFSADDLIVLMIKLELSFEDQSRLFIPALFNDESDNNAAIGRRRLFWEGHHNLEDGQRLHHVGRRLECEDPSLTFLTPGFFPRLQVKLRNYLHAENVTKRFTVARNLIRFLYNGMEVLVEYCGDIDYFVDILIRSSALPETTLKYLEEDLVPRIRQFCASPQGCPGVQLAEAVIRPVCVREPFECINRKPHAVRVSDLETRISGENGYDYKHTWRVPIARESDMDFALDLLRGEGAHLRLVAATQVDQADGSQARSGQAFRPDVSRSQIQLPRLFFPTIDDVSFITRLEAKMNLAKVMPIKLHIMCDGIDGVHGPHEVEDQPGRTLKLDEKSGGYKLPIMKYAVRLLWMGINVARGMFLPGATIQEIDDWVKNLFNEEEAQITVDVLKRMFEHRSTSSTSTLPSARILELLDKYMRIDPHTEWLSRFLNVAESKRFFEDFKLWKVKCIGDESDVRWLCGRCYESECLKGRVISVPH